jgi:hypothetical protein
MTATLRPSRRFLDAWVTRWATSKGTIQNHAKGSDSIADKRFLFDS